MSRLTKYFADRDEYGHNSCHGGCESCTGVLCGDAFEMIKKLAHYEDLEEQGRLIELPCKVGDTVWAVLHNEMLYWNGEPRYQIKTVKFHCGLLHEFGRRIFLTKEEAEAKLAELKGE